MDRPLSPQFNISALLNSGAIFAEESRQIVQVKDGKINTVSDLLEAEQLTPVLERYTSHAQNPLFQPVSADYTNPLAQILELLRQDAYESRDKLLMLNPTRRDLVARRIAFNAARIARARGERMNRQVLLPELLRESYRPQQKEKTLSLLSLERFCSEVAFYHLMQVFALKCLDVSGWRIYQDCDFSRANYELNTFLKSKSLGFNTDRHSWNFVRPNIYSWYQPSAKITTFAHQYINGTQPQSARHWTTAELGDFLNSLPADSGLNHLGFGSDHSAARLVWDFIEQELGFSHITSFQGRAHAKKIFFPTVESGGLVTEAINRLINGAALRSDDADTKSWERLLHESIWSCEQEGLEVYFVELLSLLKVAQHPCLKQAQLALSNNVLTHPVRLPHGTRIVQGIALELHNLEQLALGEASGCVQYGSAAVIQEYENFDLSVVVDHPDRSKSTRWMKQVAEQIPYWRTWINPNTNLNWGELHLHLALSKLKEFGRVVYLSHRVLPEHEDGERLRHHILDCSKLDYFIELPEGTFAPYRYLYVFTKTSNKKDRDENRVKHGKWPELAPVVTEGRSLSVVNTPQVHKLYDESTCQQWEIAERGWDQIFVKGAGPLIRHLNHKCAKLFQFATIQLWSPVKDTGLGSESKDSLFGNKLVDGLELVRENGKVQFVPLRDGPQERIAIFPHNSADLPWLEHVLNAPATCFWINAHIPAEQNSLRLQDIRNIPIVDLSRVNPQLVHDTLEWLGRARPNGDTIRRWLCENESAGHGARFVAFCKRRKVLEKSIERYRHMFDVLNCDQAELDPEAVPRFYPKALLTSLLSCPDVRVQYTKKELSSINPNNWILKESIVTPSLPGRENDKTLIHLFMKQGPQVMLSVPQSVVPYLMAQLRKLIDFTWGEIQGLLLTPRDIGLFTAQSAEITRVVLSNVREVHDLLQICNELSLDLFDVPSEDRGHLTL